MAEAMYELDPSDRLMIEQFHAERAANPDLAPYIGPEETLERFLSGEVVTAHDLLTDQSKFVGRNILPEQMRRLRWMLDNLLSRTEQEQE